MPWWPPVPPPACPTLPSPSGNRSTTPSASSWRPGGADKISRTTRGLDGTTGDWRQELDDTGRIELVGYDVYKPMVDSLG